MSISILDIQTALNNQGFNPGEIDGIWGRRTIAAVKVFQQAHGLKPDGIVGPLTVRALMGTPVNSVAGSSDPDTAPLVWYQTALSLIGTTEVSGKGSSRTILQWAKNLDIDYGNDDIPWCGLFVAHCIGSSLPEEPLPSGPLLARNWRKFGDSCSPMRGAVLVFWRGSPTGSQGHVGFYHSEDNEAFHVLGGNQSDSVNLARIGKDRLLAARWPRTAAILTGMVVMEKGQGKLSHNEA